MSSVSSKEGSVLVSAKHSPLRTVFVIYHILGERHQRFAL